MSGPGPIPGEPALTWQNSWSGWPDLNRRPLRPERGSATSFAFGPAKTRRSGPWVSLVSVTRSRSSRLRLLHHFSTRRHNWHGRSAYTPGGSVLVGRGSINARAQGEASLSVWAQG